jgi:biopolymer transport protein ExbB/TolQ
LLSRTGVNYSAKSLQFCLLTVHQVLEEVEIKSRKFIDLAATQVIALAVARSQEQGDSIAKEFARLEALVRTSGQARKKSKQSQKSAEGLKAFLNSSIDKGFSGLSSIYSAIQTATETSPEK